MTDSIDGLALRDPMTHSAGIKDRKSLARTITAVENNLDGADAILEQIEGLTGNAHVVGFTGPPGVGKSTLIDKCIFEIRKAGKSVAVVAVDPSSDISGGAILGDRLRMAEHTLDEHVFIRSVASRGQLGGVSAATVNIVNLLDAAGWDRIIVETVGTGQSEIDVSRIADTTVVIQAPGYGDGIQAIKAGLLEVADVLAVNKADLPDAGRVVTELRQAVSLRYSETKPDVIKTSASDHSGIVELTELIEQHGRNLRQRSDFVPAAKRMRYFSAHLIASAVERGISDSDDGRLNELRRQIQSGAIDGQALANAIWRCLQPKSR